ncbi:lytic transglycosylase domain-containing protein [Marinobacterium rhizophilum]|uniref:lytic transglycosylase domain-containing protein n=1 Tax=Marinobacterium rhizophilum TaxID=420402 RepID=UPI0003733298|nr:lytic transglycosylase domain-containing protein [Marinobacterium rhizophilum]
MTLKLQSSATLLGIAIVGLSLFAVPQGQADSLRRIVHPDGRIEYTNVGRPARGDKVLNTRSGPKIYKYRKDNGVLSFTDAKPPGHVDYEIVKIQCYACNPVSSVNWRTTPLNITAYAQLVRQAAAQHQVDPALVRALIHAESAFNPSAVSHMGAQGLMQLMPATAASLGVQNAFDARQNIDGGVKHLADLLQTFKGDARLAVAAYNAGAGAVRKYGGVPPYAETQVYVERVAILRQRYNQKAGLAP